MGEEQTFEEVVEAIAQNPMVLGRKFGVEMEGYTDTNPNRFEEALPKATPKYDGSLSNNTWNSERAYYGVEIAAQATNDIRDIKRIFDFLEDHGWEIRDSKPGTHIHVDISDYKVEDVVKLMMFCCDIQPVMYMLVKDLRYSNQYCRPLYQVWSRAFNKEFQAYLSKEKMEEADSWDIDRYVNAGRKLSGLLYNHNKWHSEPFWNEKYSWLNIQTNYSTIEFRIFHAIDRFSDIVNFIRLSVAIVDTVKNSTVEQLKFIAKEIRGQATPEGMVQKLCEVLGIDTLPIQGVRAVSSVAHEAPVAELAV